MSRSPVDPGAQAKQRDPYEGDKSARTIRQILARLQPAPKQPEPEEAPWPKI